MKMQRGFSLVEALVVVIFIAILVASSIPSFQNVILRSKVQKTSDLIAQTIITARSEALRRNIKTYMEVVSGNICIGTTSGGCDIRSDPLVSGVSVSATKLVLSPFYGVPSPAPATFTVTYSGVTQSVSVNRLGVVTVGAIS